jgi:flagellar biogenesis protein FliO
MRFSFLSKLVFVPNEQGELASLDQTAAIPLEVLADMPSADYGSAMIQMLLTFITILVLLVASFWFIRRLIQNRLQKGVGDQEIHILEKRMISPKTMLYLIEVDNKKILLAESHLEVRKLETFSLPLDS